MSDWKVGQEAWYFDWPIIEYHSYEKLPYGETQWIGLNSLLIVDKEDLIDIDRKIKYGFEYFRSRGEALDALEARLTELKNEN